MPFSRVLVKIQLLIRQPSYQPTIDNEAHRWEKLNNEYRSAREACIPVIPVARAYVKWQFVIMKDFSRYPFLFPQLASDSLQNVPFCSGERGLKGHDLLVAVTPSSRQLCLASSHPLPHSLSHALPVSQQSRFRVFVYCSGDSEQKRFFFRFFENFFS